MKYDAHRIQIHCAVLVHIVQSLFHFYLRCVAFRLLLLLLLLLFSVGAKTKLTPITSQPLSKLQSHGEWRRNHADDAFDTRGCSSARANDQTRVFSTIQLPWHARRTAMRRCALSRSEWTHNSRARCMEIPLIRIHRYPHMMRTILLVVIRFALCIKAIIISILREWISGHARSSMQASNGTRTISSAIRPHQSRTLCVCVIEIFFVFGDLSPCVSTNNTPFFHSLRLV